MCSLCVFVCCALAAFLVCVCVLCGVLCFAVFAVRSCVCFARFGVCGVLPCGVGVLYGVLFFCDFMFFVCYVWVLCGFVLCVMLCLGVVLIVRVVCLLVCLGISGSGHRWASLVISGHPWPYFLFLLKIVITGLLFPEWELLTLSETVPV